MEKDFYVYIMASRKNGTLYTGVTSDLTRRISEHKQEVHEGFTKKYDVKRLVYYEVFDHIDNAIHREKRLKKYKRNAKLKLIENTNPQWKDLYEGLF